MRQGTLIITDRATGESGEVPVYGRDWKDALSRIVRCEGRGTNGDVAKRLFGGEKIVTPGFHYEVRR